ncbi:MAG: hypothetical protein NT023_09060 [Armatimonadetes bacterium]|nr:hypothetical protein [Armatimonadota bacterium]
MPKSKTLQKTSQWILPLLLLVYGGYRFWYYQQEKSLMKLDDRRVVLPECPPDPKSDREVLASALKKVEEARHRASVQKTNPQVWQKFAEVAFENQDYLSTLSALQALQKLQPQLTSRQKRLLGYSLKECGLAQSALPILREVLLAEPRSATAYVALSQCLSRLVKNEEAVEVLNQGARNIDITDVKGHDELAHEYEMHAEWEKALDMQKEAFAHSNSDPNIGTAVGLAMQNNQKVVEAQRLLEELVRRFPKHAGLHRQLGWVLNSYQRSDKSPKQAEHHYLMAVTLNPKDVMAWSLLGDICMRSSRFHASAYAYTHLLQVDPYNDMARMAVARSYMNLGLDASNITSISPGQRGIRDQAEYFMRTLRYQNPNSGNSMLQLPRHYFKFGQYVKGFHSLQSLYLIHKDKPEIPAEVSKLYKILELPMPLLPTSFTKKSVPTVRTLSGFQG